MLMRLRCYSHCGDYSFSYVLLYSTTNTTTTTAMTNVFVCVYVQVNACLSNCLYPHTPHVQNAGKLSSHSSPNKTKILAKPAVRRYHNAGTAVSILDRTLLLRCEGVDIFRRQAGVEPWQFKSQGRGPGALRYSSLNL